MSDDEDALQCTRVSLGVCYSPAYLTYTYIVFNPCRIVGYWILNEHNSKAKLNRSSFLFFSENIDEDMRSTALRLCCFISSGMKGKWSFQSGLVYFTVS